MYKTLWNGMNKQMSKSHASRIQTRVNCVTHRRCNTGFRAQEGGGAGGGPSGLRNSEMAFPLRIPALQCDPRSHMQ